MIPVIIGVNGTISKSFRKYVSNIPGKHKVKELQKTATLGTAHILQKALPQRYNGVNTVTSDMNTMNSNTRIATTRCSLGTWFVSGMLDMDKELRAFFTDCQKAYGHVSWIKLTLRRLMSYIYGAPILDVSRSHTTTQHSR